MGLPCCSLLGLRDMVYSRPTATLLAVSELCILLQCFCTVAGGRSVWKAVAIAVILALCIVLAGSVSYMHKSFNSIEYHSPKLAFKKSRMVCRTRLACGYIDSRRAIASFLYSIDDGNGAIKKFKTA